ncbi:MAG: HAMP domain-containing histidine kinase [Caulobacter sp.]|nr:HAMP domain-containing histidine kinase [Vitreoscilla sp.]
MVAPAPTPSLSSIAPDASLASPRLPGTARDFDDDDSAQGAPLLEALLADTARPSRLGLPAGAGPVFEVGALVTLAAIAMAIGGAHFGMSVSWVRLFDNVHWTVADIGAAWLAWIGVRDARERGQRAEVAARRWFALGFTSYAIGQAFWDLQAFLSWHPFPAPSDPFYMMMAPCCALGMMGYLRGRVSESQRLAAVLDTLSLAIAAVALALVVYLPERGAMSALSLGVMVTYPTLLLAGACVGVMLIALLRVGRCWPVWVLTAMLAAHGGLWMEWNALSLRHALSDGGVVNSLFSVCTLMGGLAVSCWRVEAAVDPRIERFYEGALRILPLVVVVGVTFAVTLQDSVAHLSPSARFACDAAAVIVIVLAAVRQTLQLRDRDQLIEAQRQLRDRENQLGELNQHLEQRVQARTQEADERNAELSTALQQLSMAQHELVRAEKLAGLGSLVKGVAIEISAALANADMVAMTLPAQVESLARLHAHSGDDSPRLRSQLAGYVAALDESHKQMGLSLDQARHVIGVLQQIAVDQTSDQRRTFDLLASVREICDLTRLAHRHDPIEIIVTGETELMLDSYPGSIGQVLNQLVENAIVHGFSRTGEGTISVRVWPSGHDAVRITVHDDGVGIPPADLPQGFAPFFTTRLAQGGSGLGLTISRNMVNGILGGRIEIASPPGSGTTVTLTLPRLAPRSHG